MFTMEAMPAVVAGVIGGAVTAGGIAAAVAWRRRTNGLGADTVRVNCWFCNDESIVAAVRASSWTCRHCGSYNGFGPVRRNMHRYPRRVGHSLAP